MGNWCCRRSETQKDLTYYHFAACEECSGSGAEKNSKPESCTQCSGSGQVFFKQGFFNFAQTCPRCGGEGLIIKDPCKKCKGQSRIQKYGTISITIPKGIFDQADLRIQGKGDAGIYGGTSGDLYIKVHVIADKQFHRVNDDLECTIMLTYPQLVFGAEVDITSIDESTETIKIPQGCKVGERIVIAGKGFHKIRGRTRGDLVVITNCNVPKKISPKAQELLKEYSAEIGTETSNRNGGISGFFKKFLG